MKHKNHILSNPKTEPKFASPGSGATDLQEIMLCRIHVRRRKCRQYCSNTHMFEIGMHVTPLPKKTVQTDSSNVLPKS
jgi:hypothetical protein